MTRTELTDLALAALTLVDDGVFVLSAAVAFAAEADEDLTGSPEDERKILDEAIRLVAQLLPEASDAEHARLLRLLADQEAGIDYSYTQS